MYETFGVTLYPVYNYCLFQELEYCQAVVLSVSDEAGIRVIVDELLEASKSERPESRRAAATLLCAFCTHTKADYSQHVAQLLRGLILNFTDSDQAVLQMSWEALSSVTKVFNAIFYCTNLIIGSLCTRTWLCPPLVTWIQEI